MELIKRSGISYEFRTTLVGGLHTDAHIAQLAPLMYGVRRYALQSYQPAPGETDATASLHPPTADLFNTASRALREQVEEFLVR
jgi:pyruvate formate lyase activating enzyme